MAKTFGNQSAKSWSAKLKPEEHWTKKIHRAWPTELLDTIPWNAAFLGKNAHWPIGLTNLAARQAELSPIHIHTNPIYIYIILYILIDVLTQKINSFKYICIHIFNLQFSLHLWKLHSFIGKFHLHLWCAPSPTGPEGKSTEHSCTVGHAPPKGQPTSKNLDSASLWNKKSL